MNFKNKKVAILGLGVEGISSIKFLKKGGDYVHDLLFQEPGVVGSDGNSGFQMINLASQFGATGIALIGFDMRLDQGAHWHGAHKVPMRNPDEVRCIQWKKNIDGVSDKLKSIGVDVVNCSEISRLEKYPRMTVDRSNTQRRN